jgi:hypothetical protein
MLHTFNRNLDGSDTAWHTLAEIEAPKSAEACPPGTCAQHPVPVNAVVGAAAGAGASASVGAEGRLAGVLGEEQARIVYLDAEPRRLACRAVVCRLQGRCVSAGVAVRFTGALGYDPKGRAEVSGGVLSHHVVHRALSYAQALTDSAISAFSNVGSLQPECRRLAVTADPLAGGSAMVPIQLLVAGRRWRDQVWIRLASVIVGTSYGGRDEVDLVPGQYDAIGYQVRGFPTANGGAATFQVVEQLDQE